MRVGIFSAMAAVICIAATPQNAYAKKEPPKIEVSEILSAQYASAVVPVEDAVSVDDRSKLIDGKHIYVGAVKAEARVGVLSIPLKSQEEELKARVSQTVRDLGYKLITDADYLEEGLFGKAVFRAWGWARIKAEKGFVEEELAMWRNRRPLPQEWWSDALLSAAAQTLEINALEDLAKDSAVCSASGGNWIYTELLARGGENGKQRLIKILKFHSSSCPRMNSARALLAGGEAAKVEEMLPTLPESLQQPLREALMDL